MILDERTEFADATAINTGAPATFNIGDVIDMTVARDIGAGQPIYLVVQVATTVTSGGAATIQVQLASDSTSSIATNGTQTIHFTSKAFALADMTAGAVLAKVAIPMEDPDYERFLGVQTVVGTAAVTAGALDAFLVLDARRWEAYPDAVN